MFISGFPLRLAALTAAVLLVAPAASAQPALFVDADATGAADGSSWADAFPDLQQALATAGAGDEVWVAESTYRPTDGTDRDASFVLVSGTGLYGGFDGTEATRDERDPEAHVTVLSGDLGVPDDLSDNAFHVVVASGVDGSTLLDGFTVTGGNGDGVTPRNRGGGIYAENSSLVVRDCRIVENRVLQTDGNGGGGGAFFGTTGAPRFEGVVFERNGLNALGGGLWLRGEAEGGQEGESLEAEARRRLRAEVSGGEVGETASEVERGALSAVLRGVEFVENTGSFGGGMNVRLATIVIIESTFLRNRAINRGGGGSNSLAAADFISVSFYGNVADPETSLNSEGGLSSSTSTLSLTNTVFVGNTADFAGALGQGGGGTSVLLNVTFTANEAEDFGGIRLANGADLIVRNGAFWNNTGGEIDEASGTSTLSHLLVAGGCPPESTCESILDADPLFVRAPDPGPDGIWGTPDDDYGDLRLQDGSPAVDFGEVDFLPADPFDLDRDGDTAEPLPLDLAGEPRVQGTSVDLGAYERQPPVAAEPEPLTSAITLDAYPNPARGPVSVALRLDRAQRAEVALFDVLGREVAVLHDGPLAAGRHAFRLATAALPSGLYLLRLRGATGSITRRIVLLR